MKNVINFYFINYINIDNHTINIIIIITWQQNLTDVMVKASMDISQGTWFRVSSPTCCSWVLTLIIIVIAYIIFINKNSNNN